MMVLCFLEMLHPITAVHQWMMRISYQRHQYTIGRTIFVASVTGIPKFTMQYSSFAQLLTNIVNQLP